MSATPRPWWIDRPHKESYVQLIRANGPGGNRAAIANIYTYRGIEQAEADARLIVQAVNVHEELLDAIRAAQGYLGNLPPTDANMAIYELLTKTLDNAEGR